MTENKEVVLVDTHLLIATFDYTDLPNRALYLGKNIYLRPFIQSVRRCTTCQWFGHTKRFCRSDQDLAHCERCAGKGHSGQDCAATSVACINCIRARASDTLHRASDPGCPSFIRQKAIKRVMAIFCMELKEADAFVEVREVDAIPDPGDRPLPILADFLLLYVGAGRASGPPEALSSELGSGLSGRPCSPASYSEAVRGRGPVSSARGRGRGLSLWSQRPISGGFSSGTFVSENLPTVSIPPPRPSFDLSGPSDPAPFGAPARSRASGSALGAPAGGADGGQPRSALGGLAHAESSISLESVIVI